MIHPKPISCLLNFPVFLFKGKRTYACDQCDKSFSFSANLSTHKLTHSESKGRCRYCKKSFRSNVRLLAHEAEHQQEVEEEGGPQEVESYLVIPVENEK